MTKPKFETPDMTQKNIDKISKMFPNCITETKDENGNLKKAVNFELLQQMLSDEIADKDEAYEFTWVGKMLQLWKLINLLEKLYVLVRKNQ